MSEETIKNPNRLSELRAERAALEVKLNALNNEEKQLLAEAKKGAITSVLELMREYKLTIADLAPAGRTRGDKPPKEPKTVAPKYKDPNSGQTWTGRGRAPKWVDKSRLEDFLIEPAATQQAAA